MVYVHWRTAKNHLKQDSPPSPMAKFCLNAYLSSQELPLYSAFQTNAIESWSNRKSLFLTFLVGSPSLRRSPCVAPPCSHPSKYYILGDWKCLDSTINIVKNTRKLELSCQHKHQDFLLWVKSFVVTHNLWVNFLCRQQSSINHQF